MTMLRSIVIAKTDICEYTPRVATLSGTELSSLLSRHKDLVSSVVAKNEGSIIKGEGDSFWIVFPSVTTAALAAVEIQQELRTIQPGKSDEERLAIKVAITLGDVLRQDRDIFGEPVNLAARIESITPPDQIYLSQAAWLALNKAEVQASFVNEFSLKGIAGPIKVYRVEQKHKTRVIKDQVLVYTDIAGFTRYYQSHSIEDTENLLTYLDELTTRVCEENGGIVRLVAGDGHFLTFSEVHLALTAIEKLCQEWNTFVDQNGISCGLRIGIHQGDVYIFRSCAYGQDLNVTAQLMDLASSERGKAVAVVTDKVRDQVVGTGWEQRLMSIRTDEPRPVGSFFRAFLETNRAYRLVVDADQPMTAT